MNQHNSVGEIAFQINELKYRVDLTDFVLFVKVQIRFGDNPICSVKFYRDKYLVRFVQTQYSSPKHYLAPEAAYPCFLFRQLLSHEIKRFNEDEANNFLYLLSLELAINTARSGFTSVSRHQKSNPP